MAGPLPSGLPGTGPMWSLWAGKSPLKETCGVDEKLTYVVGDITKTEVIEKLIATVKEKFGRLDILVNNAGWCPVKPITEMTIADYDQAFQLDVRALVELTIHALPLIRAAKGSILNLSSIGSTHRAKNLPMYQGAKSRGQLYPGVGAGAGF